MLRKNRKYQVIYLYEVMARVLAMEYWVTSFRPSRTKRMKGTFVIMAFVMAVSKENGFEPTLLRRVFCNVAEF